MRLEAEQVHVADVQEAVELFFERRWTDGLPVVPPTPAAVERMIAAGGREPQDEIGAIPPRWDIATIESVAINAVMAGCRPEYFPVVLAAIEAMLDPVHNLNGVQVTTHCCVPLTIVNGPVAKEIGVHGGIGAFGSGFRANGTIGRAIRLILWNHGGNYPGEPDMSTLAHPGKWTYCLAENEEASPWEALHVERGLPAGASAVTVFSCEAPHSMFCPGTPEQTLRTMCSTMATLGSNNTYCYGQTLVCVNPGNARALHAAGYAKADVQRYLWEHARLPLGTIKRYGGFYPTAVARWWPQDLDVEDEGQMMALVRKPEDILVLVVGPGDSGHFSMLCPGWGDYGGFAVTKQVDWPPRGLRQEG